MTYFVGIDLGGTNIKAGVVSENGELLNKLSIKTNADRSMEEIIKDMGLLAKQAIEDAGIAQTDVSAIGIGSPGTPDNAAGTLVYATNLPFRNAPMRRIIREVIDLPVYIDNDANCAAMAESVSGAAADVADSVTITIGTGIGCGVIIGNRIFSGFNQAGSEFGHTVMVAGGRQCSCGRKGCFEAYASASALASMTRDAANEHADSSMGAMIEANDGVSNARIAFDAMKNGDEVAAQVVDSYIEYLSEGLANVINTFMPEVLLIGGGVCNEGDSLMVPLREKTMSKPFFGPGVRKTEIRVAKMGNDAGIVGAAMMGKACFDDKLQG
ncbi:MAG: ROK family protein [Clostridiales bacterium]|nr:ROK family protein [Candidatus Scatonaster coprocaballi]